VTAFPHLLGLRYRYLAELAGGALLALSWLAWWVSRVIGAVTMAGVPNCPRCGLLNTSRPAPSLGSDWVFRTFGCSPYRCDVCRERYFRPAR